MELDVKNQSVLQLLPSITIENNARKIEPGFDKLTNNKKAFICEEIKEVILALSTTMEGQTTSHVIADKLEQFNELTITKLAQGIPIGGEVHYLDENTLSTAFQSRKKII